MTLTTVSLNAKNLFTNYLVHPRSKDLSKRDKRIATLVLIAFVFPPLFFVPFGVWLVRKIRSINLGESDTLGMSNASSAKSGSSSKASASKTNATAEQVISKEKSKEISKEITVEAPEEPEAPKAPPAPKKKPTPPPKKPRLTPAQREQRIEERRAVELARIVASENPERKLAVGMPNELEKKDVKDVLKNVCYFNSSVQCLEALFMSDDAFVQILTKDLSKQDGETLEQLEERVLKDWAPCDHEDAEVKRKAIHFKWTFLLMLQAKQFGNAEQLYGAILSHRKSLFSSRRCELRDNSGQWRQQDAAVYFECFSSLLNIGTFYTYPEMVAGNDSYPRDFETSHLFQLKGISEEEISLSELIQHQFLPKKLDKPHKVRREGSPEQIYPFERVKMCMEAPPVLFLHLIMFANIEVETSKKEFIKVPFVANDDSLGSYIDFHTVEKDLPPRTDPANKRIQHQIQIDPEEVIDLSSYYGEEEGTHLYELVATCNHSGGETVQSGHYTANIKSNDQWSLANDGSVRDVENPDFSNAYILVLRKIEPNAEN